MKSSVCVESQPMFRGNISTPSCGSKNNPSKKKNSLQSDFTLVSCSAYSLNLKMEMICSSEMSVDFQRTTCISEDRTLQGQF
jgi:hypothetical protein